MSEDPVEATVQEIAMRALVMCEDRWYWLCRSLLETVVDRGSVARLVDVVGEALDGIDASADESERTTALVDLHSKAYEAAREQGRVSPERKKVAQAASKFAARRTAWSRARCDLFGDKAADALLSAFPISELDRSVQVNPEAPR